MPRKGEKLSPEQLEKWSRVKIERHLRVRKEYVAQPDHKRCTGCGETKAISDFYPCRRKLKSGGFSIHPSSRCKACNVKRVQEWREQKKQEGTYLDWRRKWAGNERERRLERDRENRATKRAEKNLAPRGWKKYRVDARNGTNQRRSLSAAPIVSFLQGRLEKESQAMIGERTGIPQRRLYALLSGEQIRVSVASVDRILQGLGFPEEFACLYDDSPPNPPRSGYVYVYVDSNGVVEEDLLKPEK